MSNETEMRAILQELHDKFGMATEAPSKPFAYYIHIAAEQRGEFVHDLDEALDDLTNCECKITELFDRATPAPAVGASVQPVLASLSREQIDQLIQQHVDPVATYPRLVAFARAVLDLASSTPTNPGAATPKESA